MNILQRKEIGKDTSVILVEDSVHHENCLYQVSISITNLEKPYYNNHLFRVFTDQEKAIEFYKNVCEMREQDE